MQIHARWRRILGLSLMLLAAGCGDDETTGGPTQLTRDVGVNDVSILYPLPADISLRTSLIGAAASGARGELLPRALYLSLPPLHTTTSNDESYDFLRVVGIRIDPCFPGLDVPSEDACKNQIRLVLQPIMIKQDGSRLVAMDVAVHLFYALDRAELSQVLAEVVALREAAGVAREDGPLDVHPALRSEGVDGAFADGLRDVLLRHAGEKNLTRVTFMGNEQVGLVWRFGGFEYQNGELSPISIKLVDVTEQTFHNEDLAGATFENAGSFPVSPSIDDIRLFFNPTQADAASDAERQAAYDAALRIESPEKNSPDTIDCATCHAAMAARQFAEQRYGLVADGNPNLYQHPDGLPLEGANIEATNELRAFGYLEDRTSISQRVVNETAAVVAHVNEVVVTR